MAGGVPQPFFTTVYLVYTAGYTNLLSALIPSLSSPLLKGPTEDITQYRLNPMHGGRCRKFLAACTSTVDRPWDNPSGY